MWGQVAPSPGVCGAQEPSLITPEPDTEPEPAASGPATERILLGAFDTATMCSLEIIYKVLLRHSDHLTVKNLCDSVLQSIFFLFKSSVFNPVSQMMILS